MIEELSNVINKMDCLIIIGSTISVGYSQYIFTEALNLKKCYIIEINPKPLIQGQNIIRLSGDLEDSVPRLCKVI